MGECIVGDTKSVDASSGDGSSKDSDGSGTHNESSAKVTFEARARDKNNGKARTKGEENESKEGKPWLLSKLQRSWKLLIRCQANGLCPRDLMNSKRSAVIG